MICGQPIDRTLKRPHPKALAIDHTVALAAGGSNAPSNLAATHADCNLRKGANAA